MTKQGHKITPTDNKILYYYPRKKQPAIANNGCKYIYFRIDPYIYFSLKCMVC